MLCELLRDDFHPLRTFGKWFVDGVYLAETLEDADRDLERDGTADGALDGSGVKIQGKTAIPRGRYRMRLSMSSRFGKIMPEIYPVPGFTGVRAHGGNTEANTDGCPLLGAVRESTRISNCAGVNQRLINLMEAAEARGEEIWLDVR